jgi:hypothetical protein
MSIKISPLLECYAESNAKLGEVFGMKTVISEVLPRIDTQDFIMDLSPVPKCLVVGGESRQWITEQIDGELGGLFDCHLQKNGGFIPEIIRDQFLAVNGTNEATWTSFTENFHASGSKTLILPYDCAEFIVGGPNIWNLLYALTSFDLDSLKPNQLSPMRIATVDVYVLPYKNMLRVFCTPADGYFLFNTVKASIISGGGVSMGFNPSIDSLCVSN